MTVDSLIQIVAIAVAVYALVPRARQLEMAVRFGAFWGILGVLYVVVITILLYYQQLQKLFYLPPWPNKWVFLPEDVAFFTTIYLIGALWFIYQRTNIGRKDIFRFQELVEELLRLEEYPELISILDQHWARLLLIRENKFLFLGLRSALQKSALNIAPDNHSLEVFDKLDALDFEDLLDRPKNRKIRKGKKLNKYVRNLTWKSLVWISKCLPDYSKYSDTADDILQATLLNEGLVETLSNVRPYFALKIFATKLLQKEEFVRLYIYCLLRNNQSILYYEIRENQEMDSDGGYKIPPKNRLLHYLLKDVSNAEELKIWKPVGDEVINYLEELSIKNDDSYNHPMANFFEEGKWRSPIYIGIFFFNIMVTNAFYQGTNWHMWLYYYPHFIEVMIKNYKPHTTAELSSEWPTRYSCLIYENFQALENFITLDNDNVSSKGKTEITMKEIPKHSIKAMVHCLQHVFSPHNKNMTEQFKEYLASIVFRLFFEMIEEPNLKIYALELRNQLFDKSNPHGFVDRFTSYFSAFQKLDYSEEHLRLFLHGK